MNGETHLVAAGHVERSAVPRLPARLVLRVVDHLERDGRVDAVDGVVVPGECLD